VGVLCRRPKGHNRGDEDDDTYQLVKDHIDARPAKELTVKARDMPVMTYDVLGLQGKPAAPRSEPSDSDPAV